MLVMNMLQHLGSQRKPVAIAPRKMPKTVTESTNFSVLEPSDLKKTNNEMELISYNDLTPSDSIDEEPITIVEPTDPDEDRRMAEEEETVMVLKEPEQKPFRIESKDLHPPGITTDPILLSQILHALSAKPIKTQPSFPIPVSSLESFLPIPTTLSPIVNSTLPQSRIIVASSNMFTLQTPTPIQSTVNFPKSILPQLFNSSQTTKVVTSTLSSLETKPKSSSLENSSTEGISNDVFNQSMKNANLQQLISNNPLLSAFLVNCTTANIISQLANSISASMLSFAQNIAAEKPHNLSSQISELSQMLAALISLATTLTSSLPGLSNLGTAPSQKSNPILTSLINQMSPPGTQPVSSVIPLANFKLVSGIGRNIIDQSPITSISTQSTSSLSLSSEFSNSPLYGTSLFVPNITISQAHSGPLPSIPCSNSTTTVSGSKLNVYSLNKDSNNPNNRIKRFCCTYAGCGSSFYSRFNLIEHIRTHTGERPFVCPVSGCNSRFKRRRDLSEHDGIHRSRQASDGGPLLALLTEEPDKDDSGVADLSANTGDEDGDDLDDEDGDDEDDDETAQPDESKSENGINKYKEELLTNGVAPIQWIDDGNRTLIRKRRRHFCPFPNCIRSYARRHRLNQHMCQHTGIGPYYCDQPSCSVKYFCASDLDRHKLIHLVPTSGDPLKRHLCPFPGCGKAYSKLNKLREHVRSHTGERPYVCEHPGCTASFIRLYGLKRHQLTHNAISSNTDDTKYTNILPDFGISMAPATPLKPLSGSLAAIFPQSQIICSESAPATVSESLLSTSSVKPSQVSGQIMQNSQADSHMAPQTEATITLSDNDTVETIKIDEPQTESTNSATTIRNLSRSSKASATPSASAMALNAVVIPGPFGKRRHICPMAGCKKIFPKLNKLREHICRHTGERPYACDECPATFVRMYDLRRHALIHLRKKNGLLSTGIQ